MRKLVAGAVVVAGLAGCGGSGGDVDGPEPTPDAIGTTRAPVGTYTDLADGSTSVVTPLAYVAHTNGGAGQGGDAGDLDHVAGTISGGLFTGTLNAARTRVMLDGGGTVRLVATDDTEHSRSFTAETLGPLFGVVGQLTEAADMPFGSDPTTTYVGRAQVTVAHDTSVYDLSGLATITANWGTSRVDVRLHDLDGERSTAGMTSTVDDVAVIRLDDAVLTDAEFVGGAPSITSSEIGLVAGASSAGSAGAFFGPGADEVGGVVLIDDTATATGETRVLGSYLAD